MPRTSCVARRSACRFGSGDKAHSVDSGYSVFLPGLLPCLAGDEKSRRIRMASYEAYYSG